MNRAIDREGLVYIVAPANVATGGPELLHQLAYKLRERGCRVFMYYLPAGSPQPVHKNYEQYQIPIAKKIEDVDGNAIICPEVETDVLKKFSNIRKIIWWLSVDFHFLSAKSTKKYINIFLLKCLGIQKYLFFNKKDVASSFHFVQSEYARQFLLDKGFNEPYLLSDYLHSSFLSSTTDISKKKNIVAYNPLKGKRFTEKLINKCSNIDFIPIENMSRQEVVELLQKAKVYIDFGFHPGKDRIPREAAFLKCCVITNRKGAAKYYKDVPIPDCYKFEDNAKSIKYIELKIKDCFSNYEERLLDFEKYRCEIYKQESVFNEEISRLLDP